MPSKVDQIEEIMLINPLTGTSDWWDIRVLEEHVGFPLSGNGSPFFQSDRGLGKKYTLEKQRDKGNRLTSVRCTGFAPHHQTNRAQGIPQEVREWFRSGLPCAMCGTRSNVVPDHKDGNKQPIKPGAKDFQPLCTHCNSVKREVCKRCSSTGNRFDARTLGYSVGWVQGGVRFQPRTPRCVGCYWCSPLEFRAGLVMKVGDR